MNNDNFNMSMRKFLKQVGVTSQQQLEKAAGEMPAGSSAMKVKMVLTVVDTDFEHIVEGSIELGD